MELMSPPPTAPPTAASGASAAFREEVLKTLEYFGIYQRFECIKCHGEFATMNLALSHLRGEYIDCKSGSVSKNMLSKKKVFVPKKLKKFSPKINKEVAPLSSSKHKSSKYSPKQVEMILSKKKKDNVLAKQFKVTTKHIAKFRYNWNKKNKIIVNTKSYKKHKKPYKINKAARGNQEYKIQPGEDAL